MTFRQVQTDEVQPGERVALARWLPSRLVTATAPAPGHKRRLTLDDGGSFSLATNRLVWIREDLMVGPGRGGMSDPLDELRQQCHYSPEGGVDDEGYDLGSVDSLIAYKDALEDWLYSLLAPAPVAQACPRCGDSGYLDVLGRRWCSNYACPHTDELPGPSPTDGQSTGRT